MLTELIDKIDCNPELMMTLAEQLGTLTNHLGQNEEEKAENCAHLLRPLEIISGSDDSVVQTKAINSLKKITEVLNENTINGQYVDLIGRLDEGDYYSMRIAACQLYAQIYRSLNEEKREVVRTKFTKLVRDDTPMVRWGAAQAMAVICHALDAQTITNYLLPLLKELLQDKNDSVKVHAV